MAINEVAEPPFPDLVMAECVLWNNSSQLINCILSHDVHWCHTQPWNQHYTDDQDGDAVAVLDIFVNQFLK